MFLKKIELQGFKSFASRTVLEFNKGLTAIIGPNGSGKSNFADAVRWVLGSQSSKQLRGDSMGDMIFSGTQFRKPVGFAEVSLFIDNTSKSLSLEFDEVKITRRLYRSGESDYYINDKTCRLKDIQMLFFDTGIGKEGYSIVGQGEVQEILSSNSVDRRGIFEEAAGIMKYKQKKLDALKKLQSTEDNMIRINDIISEIENQLEPLRQQSEKAKEYLRVYEILKTNEVGLYLNNMEMFRKRIVKYDQDIADINEEIRIRETELEKIKQESRESYDVISEYENQENSLKEKLNEYIMGIESARHDIILGRERLQNAITEETKDKNEIKDFELREKELTKDYSSKEERRAYLEKQYDGFKKKLDELQTEADQIIASLSGSEMILENIKASLMKYMEDASDIRLSINNIENEKRTVESQIESLSTNISRVILDNDAVLLAKQEDQQLYKNAKKQLDDLLKLHASLKEEYAKCEKELEDCRIKEQKAKTHLEISESNYKLISDMEKHMQGYKQDVKAVLENDKLIGIVDVVAKLFNTEDMYTTAIEAALGGNLQNVVVDDEEAAKQAINYLKSNKMGRVTFLPVNAIRPNDFDKNQENEIMKQEGVIDIAYRMLEYDKKYDNIARNLLGKIVIVDKYDNAVAISRKTQNRYKLVTLTGEFFNTGGSITGGTLNASNIGLLGRKQHLVKLDEEIHDQKNKLGEIESATINKNRQLSKLVEDIAKCDKNINESNISITKYESVINTLDEKYSSNVNALTASKNKKSEMETKYTEFDSKISGLKNEISNINKEMDNCRSKIAAYEQDNKADAVKRDNIYLDISDFKVSVNSIEESLKNNDESLIRIGFEKQALIVKCNVLKKRNEELVHLKETLQNEINEKSKSICDPEKTKDSMNKEIESITNKRKSLLDEHNNYIQSITEENKSIMLLQNKISVLEIGKAKTDSEMQAMKDRMWDEYNMTHNEAMEKNTEIENVTEARKEIAYAKGIIKELGPINIASIDDYTKTNERYRFYTVQRDDIMKSKDDLYKTVNEMNTVMRKLFTEKFAIINENFNEIFIELFDGGQARLELTDDNDILECGIDIIVQPPGKKLQNMMLLSGGEKAFTAIALLFAMLELNPSPFCIFDEIETSLDENNVLKYCKYLNQHKDKTQFILITHRKGTMENCDSIYGATMQEHGVTKVVSMKFGE
ncbi:MAG: chromosome segregation protein SMC [Clostridia bacterium]